MISPVQIATNRYAPPGAQAINMYQLDNGETLTLGQLMAAVCIRAGANMEAQTIPKINTMNGNTETLTTASGYLQRLAEDTIQVSEWPTVRTWLINVLGVESSALPTYLGNSAASTTTTYAKRFQAINAMKVKLEALTRQAQEDMIDVQSMINKRDVAFTTGTSLIKELGSSQNNIATVL